MGRPALKIEITLEERAALENVVKSHSVPELLARRAKIVLMALSGLPNAAVATRFGISQPAVTYWKKRYAAMGLAGLVEQKGPAQQAA
jgi:hypothetical protein